MRYFTITSGLLACATSVLGHSTFQDMWVDGYVFAVSTLTVLFINSTDSTDDVSTCARLPLNNNPVTNVTSNDLRCNAGTTPVTPLCTVATGGNVTVEMHAQPGDRDCTKEAIGGNHYGPVLVYMSKVANAASDTGSGSWFKVAEEGYNPTTKIWGTDSLNTNCGKKSFIVPADLAPGNYLVRAEAIALHVASTIGGAQFYMTCFQINLTGSGTATPAGVTFPGAYSASDPGILINIYDNLQSYTIPGPAVFTG
ncbi:putative endo-beta-1,4-glucanase D [Lachnellula hyalina]|uniref:AA9 family lytic polysaccharide monooxygenase n=1 Tax=Lachnellula hyalina TaxID=1316788 RepID=A0A8H8R7N4_9HELO|nr:putative endo-beta-1,4-glucanase D [Lachnellula hyalina]TVY29055.1 putative endo-beta-1,4-glucanase D [Lachnellula hyalina]